MSSMLVANSMKLGILKTDNVHSTCINILGEYPDMFIKLLKTVTPLIEYTVYDVQKKHYPEIIDEVDAYLITGSKFSAYDDESWVHYLMAFVH